MAEPASLPHPDGRLDGGNPFPLPSFPWVFEKSGWKVVSKIEQLIYGNVTDFVLHQLCWALGPS